MEPATVTGADGLPAGGNHDGSGKEATGSPRLLERASQGEHTCGALRGDQRRGVGWQQAAGVSGELTLV